jgi:NADH:ubiquinone oxidoreductase subunit 5 (subunit L)/multisubunit Na+/H+ antiporter MnhA subunit
MHHDQDMRNMGGLRKYMPITYVTMLIRQPRARGHPAVRRILLQGRAHRGGPCVDGSRHAYAIFAVVRRRVRARPFYSFRLIFMTFHGPERFRNPGPRPRTRPGMASTVREAAITPPRTTGTITPHGDPREEPVGRHAAADPLAIRPGLPSAG